MEEKEIRKIPESGYYIAHFRYHKWVWYEDLPSYLPIGELTCDNISYLLEAGKLMKIGDPVFSGSVHKWPRKIRTKNTMAADDVMKDNQKEHGVITVQDNTESITSDSTNPLLSDCPPVLNLPKARIMLGNRNYFDVLAKNSTKNEIVLSYPLEKVTLLNIRSSLDGFWKHRLLAKATSGSVGIDIYKHIRAKIDRHNRFMINNNIHSQIAASLFDAVIAEVTAVIEHISIVRQFKPILGHIFGPVELDQGKRFMGTDRVYSLANLNKSESLFSFSDDLVDAVQTFKNRDEWVDFQIYVLKKTYEGARLDWNALSEEERKTIDSKKYGTVSNQNTLIQAKSRKTKNQKKI